MCPTQKPSLSPFPPRALSPTRSHSRMLIRRIVLTKSLHHFRFFSHSKAGRVPSIVFEQEDGQRGGNKRLISVQANQIRKLVNHLGRSHFLSRLFDLEVLESTDVIEKVRVLPRKVHLEAGSYPLNVTFIRAPSSALLKVEVPLVFRGEDVSPGLKKGSYLNIIKRTVKFLCPADVIPPYIDVDLSELDVNQKLLMGDVRVHPALKLIQPEDHPVVKIAGARVSDQNDFY